MVQIQARHDVQSIRTTRTKIKYRAKIKMFSTQFQGREKNPKRRGKC